MTRHGGIRARRAAGAMGDMEGASDSELRAKIKGLADAALRVLEPSTE